jgi:two-component system, cell cycle response regulator
MPGNVLIIDDSATIRGEIVHTLRGASLFDRYLEAQDGIEGLKLLVSSPVDLVLCDLEMPRMDGFKFISLLSSREQLRDIPVIMLTGHGERGLKIKGLEEGAVDYLTKPFDAAELVARVKIQQKIKALQDDLRRSNEMLRELSNTDFLTGLYNRRFLMDVLEIEFQRMLRKEGHLSLIIADIDHFKRINDTFGHQQGDTVLVRLADATRASLRRYDIAARYGGEEFVILLPETSFAEGMVVAERLRRAVAEMTFSPPMERLTVTISLGLTSYPELPLDSVEELLNKADEALYRAKQNGRNRVETLVTRPS